MKLSKLLATRQALLRQAHLASLAHAYLELRQLAARIARANLVGPVRLQAAEPHDERYWPTLTALAGSQAQLEEHFSDQDLMELADAVALAIESDFDEIEFDLEDVGQFFVAPLRFALEQGGVTLDLDDAPHAPPKAAKKSGE